MTTAPAPGLTHVCDFVIKLSRPHEMGVSPAGTRRIIPVVGGTVSGPLLNGWLLNVGADWQTVQSGGIAQLDARYAMETDDGAVIEIVGLGIRHASPEVTARIAAGGAAGRLLHAFVRKAGIRPRKLRLGQSRAVRRHRRQGGFDGEALGLPDRLTGASAPRAIRRICATTRVAFLMRVNLRSAVAWMDHTTRESGICSIISNMSPLGRQRFCSPPRQRAQWPPKRSSSSVKARKAGRPRLRTVSSCASRQRATTSRSHPTLPRSRAI